jgi:hypothetical protein
VLRAFLLFLFYLPVGCPVPNKRNHGKVVMGTSGAQGHASRRFGDPAWCPALPGERNGKLSLARIAVILATLSNESRNR